MPPGGPAQPPAGTTTGCPMSGAARGGDEGAAGAAPDRGPAHGLRLRPEARPREPKTAARGAPGGERADRKARRRSQGGKLWCATRRSTPSLFFLRGKDDGVPGAAKNTGDVARLL